jgi:HD-GYP domain-containing protein (c-di-GMP phosphodiesterase class II)
MAEHLGMRAQAVADTCVAGMLHDLGLTTLPTGQVRSTGVSGGRAISSYPARGVALLRGLSFLSGALDAIAHHRDAVAPRGTGDELGAEALIVGLADEYDLLTEVGTPDGVLIPKDEALALVRRTPAGREDLIRALEHALSLRVEGAT